MPRIPDEIASLGFSNTAEGRAFRRVLIAAVLREEDGEIILTRDDLKSADGYSLKVTSIPEEGGVVLTTVVRRRP